MAGQPEMMGKREKILRSAFQVFTEKGFHVAKVSDVAELAKVGKGTVYEYFSNKEDLLRGVIEEGIHFYMNQLNLQIVSSATPWEKIKNLLKKHGEILRNDQKMSQLIFENFGVMTQEFHQFLLEQRQGFIRMIQDILQDGIDQGQIRPIPLELGARIVLGMIVAIHCEDQCLSDSSIDQMIVTLERGFLS
ncbi:TetR/AcrR family transcriptional regulator [Tepidibacillus marianensis]|uniref:TetR/AcrR family transcriptional regulator n=1 Tax=Tepidibacillus marianensis TaxID=3131995 RepID=UPI0030CACF20